MKYINVAGILPKELLLQIQKHIHGEWVYIPNPQGVRRRWGENTGCRQNLDVRNEQIRHRFSLGESINDLSNQYNLSYDSIKKIIYSKK